MNMRQIRQKYPEYSDMSDMELADNFHKNFYSDIPKDEFYKKIGVSNTFLDRLNDSPAVNSILGAGDAIRNQLANVGNLIPGVNIPMAKTGQGTAYNVGNVAGNVAGYIGGGELLAPTKLGQLAAKGLGQAGRRIAGGSAYGAVEDPEDRLRGAAFGAGAGAIGEAIPKVGGAIARGFQPEKQAQELIKYINGGQSLPENATMLSQLIKQAGESAKKRGSDVYSASYKQPGVSDLRILDELEHPGSRNTYRYINGKKQYAPKFDLDIPNPSAKLKEYIQKFDKNPTVSNAHELQSLLGSEAAGIKSIDMVSGATKNAYKNARQKINERLNQRLETFNPEVAKQYRQAGQFHKQYVSPYSENKRILDIMSGKTENPNIKTLFSNPTIKREQILEDIGHEGQKRALYGALNLNNPSASSLVKKFNNLEQMGIDIPVSPKVNKMFEGVNKAINRRDTGRRLLSAIPFAAAAKTAGLPGGEITGALIGMFKGPEFVNQLKFNRSPFQNTVSDLLGKTYGTTIKSIIANEPNIAK